MVKIYNPQHKVISDRLDVKNIKQAANINEVRNPVLGHNCSHPTMGASVLNKFKCARKYFEKFRQKLKTCQKHLKCCLDVILEIDKCVRDKP